MKTFEKAPGATAAERATARSSRAPIEELRPPPRVVLAENALEEIAESERDLIDTCPRLIGDLLVVELDADVQDGFVDDAEGPGADVVGRIRRERSGLHERARIGILGRLAGDPPLRVVGLVPHERDEGPIAAAGTGEEVVARLGVPAEELPTDGSIPLQAARVVDLFR